MGGYGLIEEEEKVNVVGKAFQLFSVEVINSTVRLKKKRKKGNIISGHIFVGQNRNG